MRQIICGVFTILAALLPFTGPAYATAGIGEWSIYTPGGNVIRHEDGWKEEFGDCLTPDMEAASSTGRIKRGVYVDFLERWKYYPGFIIGRAKKGAFIFNETSKDVRYFESDEALNGEVAKLKMRDSISDWLDASDGWAEDWAPIDLWARCLACANSDDLNPTMKQFIVAQKQLISMSGGCAKVCDKSKLRKLLSFYKITTWGRRCAVGVHAVKPPQEQTTVIAAFCKDVESAK